MYSQFHILCSTVTNTYTHWQLIINRQRTSVLQNTHLLMCNGCLSASTVRTSECKMSLSPNPTAAVYFSSGA